MDLPSSTAETMVEKLSSARTMSDASLATSVPVMPIAMPMSACFSAGASLTPSPVIAAISPRDFKILTMICLCRGSVREKTAPSTSRSIMMRSSTSVRSCSVLSSNDFPVNDFRFMFSEDVRIPRLMAIASAVSLLSPVIMMTLMPARRHSSIACLHSARGGSIIPTKPTKARSTSMLAKAAGSASMPKCELPSQSRKAWSLMSVRTAKASVRSASRDIPAVRVLMAVLHSWLKGSRRPSGVTILVQRSNTLSGAPFT
mmetsp:Transcript_152256/g.270152  ORF Transcript_152256/g.270152 Transcript_152256/m.270152 type:complete len:258 (+) Transcript_152256:924-1697(+)